MQVRIQQRGAIQYTEAVTSTTLTLSNEEGVSRFLGISNSEEHLSWKSLRVGRGSQPRCLTALTLSQAFPGFGDTSSQRPPRSVGEWINEL